MAGDQNGYSAKEFGQFVEKVKQALSMAEKAMKMAKEAKDDNRKILNRLMIALLAIVAGLITIIIQNASNGAGP